MQMTELAIVETTESWALKELSPRHKQAAALLAQGVQRQIIARVCEFTPEYITMLGRQPLFRAYIKEMSEFTDARLEALFDQSVDVIADTMLTGTEDGRLKAAKLQLEATGRVGRFHTPAPAQGGSDRLELLAERLVGLLHQQRRRTYEGEVVDASQENVG